MQGEFFGRCRLVKTLSGILMGAPTLKIISYVDEGSNYYLYTEKNKKNWGRRQSEHKTCLNAIEKKWEPSERAVSDRVGVDGKWINKKNTFCVDTFLDFLIKNDTPLKKYTSVYPKVMSHKIISTFEPKKSKTKLPSKNDATGVFWIKKLLCGREV